MVKKVFGNIYIYFILFLMYLPILFLIIFSFTDAPVTGMWTGFSLRLYVDVFTHPKIMPALFNTLLIASASALVATILGTMGAIGVFYMKKKPRQVLETVNEIPVVNADVVIAISLALLFKITVDTLNNMGLNVSGNNFFTLLVGHVVLTTSFVFLNVKPKLLQMDPNDYEAALDLGAKPLYALVKVIIPAILPGIVSGFMLAFTLSLDDFIITSFLRDKAFDTLSTYVQGVIVKSVIPAELRALTTYIFIITSLIVIANSRTKKSKALERASKRATLRKGAR